MKISIYSRSEIENLIDEGFPSNTAVISFYDPAGIRSDNLNPVDYKGKAEMLFQVAVYDIDITVLKDYGLTYETYLPESDNIAKFIKTAHDKGLDIICQCQYGQSRSAACAAAIQEYYNKNGISVFADYCYYPNQVIYHKIYDALKQ
ncbi:MAG: hypothetical protein NC213_08130 [Acetobacter sp.]|nr:hypothetical protein [Bacteroides sp.]MCM1341697.1 hypothetical protein [Acetobacter sp.]MCM1432365.1 hypothetical protein [Clostridiales bacterium]